MKTKIIQQLLSLAGGRCLLAAGSCLLATLVAAAEPPQYEPPPTLDAAAVLPPELRQGPHHRVAGEVENDGFLNHFTLESDFGLFAVPGEDLLRIRVRELAALAALGEVTRSQAFAGAVGEAAKAPVETVTQVATHPVATVKGLPSGVSRFFKRTARQVKSVAGEVNEHLDEGEEGSEAGEGSEDAEGEGTAAKARKTADAATRRYLGVDESAREWARKLGVDPYTSNEALQRELGRVASAASVGRFGARLAMPDLGALDVLGEVNDLVWTLSAADLEVMNGKRLKEMGLEKAEIEALFVNPAYSPSRITGLVTALDGIAGVPGRAELVRAAGAAASEEEALFFERSAVLLHAYHGEVAALREIVPGGGWGAGRTAAGAIVMTLALDYVPWTEEAAVALREAAGRFRAAGGERLELWLTGRVSPRARQELEGLGWTIEERARERLLGPAQATSTPGG